MKVRSIPFTRTATSPLARRLKQQRVQREESMIMKEEEEARKRHRLEEQKREKFEEEKKVELVGSKKADSYNEIKYQENKVEIKSGSSTPQKVSAETADPRRRKKEKSNLQIDEGTALKEMSKVLLMLNFLQLSCLTLIIPLKLYQDLLERFEELRQKQEAQMSAESDSTRLRRLAKTDPSVTEALHDVVEAIKKALHDFKTCANLAGAMLPNAVLHERELSHILLELECASVHQ
ncbi:hypothetical protein OSTOST_09955 [Ostertagia ostertagi]